MLTPLAYIHVGKVLPTYTLFQGREFNKEVLIFLRASAAGFVF
jgi:hypothetical protein